MTTTKDVSISWRCDLCGYDENAQPAESCELCGLMLASNGIERQRL
jgi:rubrerythrin